MHSRRVPTGRGSQIRINGPERPRASHLHRRSGCRLRGRLRARDGRSRSPRVVLLRATALEARRILHWSRRSIRRSGPAAEDSCHISGRSLRRTSVTPAPAVTPPAKRATHRSHADSALRFPKVASCIRAAVELSDTSHGVRCLSTKSAPRIVVSVYLPDTIRSRSFSLPQRFHPLDASWLCFTPLPSTGFRPSELFPRDQP